MTRRFRVPFAVALTLGVGFPSLAAAEEIAWAKDLPAAFAQAKKDQRILMICVNAKFVSGRKTEEPAAKGLREVVYKNAKVVKKAKEFVCAFLTPAGKADEFAELRALGIGGMIVSPQHIFVHPDGKKILVRREYWSYGKGDRAVEALLNLMNRAHQELAGGKDTPESEGSKKEAGKPEEKGPTEGDRPAWIQERLRRIVEGPRKDRAGLIELLFRSDKDGDCRIPLVELLGQHKKDPDLIVDLIRGLGRDRFLDADVSIAEFLGHKKAAVRGNAAVSLEYIGSRNPKVVAALRKAAGKEKDHAIANHMYRALGRCGVEDGNVRSFLLKKVGAAKSEFTSYGPTIALAYFKGDKKAARGMEKLLKKIGVPGGRRGGGQHTVKRGVLCWTLAAIGEKKSAAFMRDELLAKLENVKAFWVEGLKGFYRLVANACEGGGENLGEVAQGVRGFVQFAKGMDSERYEVQARSMMDAYRNGREWGGFTPLGDYLLGGGDM